MGPVLGSHARTDRARDTRAAEPWLPAPEDGRPGQGQRLMKRYPEPMAHGPEAREPSHPLTPAVSGISLFSNPRNLESDF